MNESSNHPLEASESKNSLVDAISKAEQIVDQYQEYLDTGKTAEHPRPSDEKMVDVFFELHNAICSNIQTLEVNKLYQILLIVQKLLNILEALKISTSDSPELLTFLNQIVALLRARKETGQLFEGIEGTA